MTEAGRKIIDLQRWPGGVGQGLRTRLRPGRIEVAGQGLDPNLQLFGSDPWGSPAATGLVLPTAPTTSAQQRYLVQLARISFNSPESAWLVGLRLYVSLFGFTSSGTVGPFEKEVTSPLWRFSLAGGNVSFHVMTVGRGYRDRRNPANSDSQVYMDSPGPGATLLYQTLGPYVPPNAGRPWGKPLHPSLGNIKDNRFPWRDDYAQISLAYPIPAPCDLVLCASVWQHDPGTISGTQNRPTLSAAQAAAASPEDAFWSAYDLVQYGRVAGSLIVAQEWGKEEEP
jgi:hypothetical protein